MSEQRMTSRSRAWIRRALMTVGAGLVIVALTAPYTGLSMTRTPTRGKIFGMALGALVFFIGLSPRRFVRFYKSLAVILLNTVVLIVALDTGVLLFYRMRSLLYTEKEFTAYYRSVDWGPAYRTEFTQSDKFTPIMSLWRRSPYSGNAINIDVRGIRHTPGARCVPDSYRIFMFGGSALWGHGVPDFATIPAYVQATLSATSERPICVVNHAESGYVADQSLFLLIEELRRGNVPDLVIFYDGVNDVFSAFASGRADIHQNFDPPANRSRWTERTLSTLSRWSETANFIRETFGEDVTYKALGQDTDTLSRAIAENYLRTHAAVGKLAEAYGFRRLFFWQPVLSGNQKKLTDEERQLRAAMDPDLVELLTATYRRIQEAVREREDLYYIGDVFDDREDYVWIDWMHVTAEGNRAVAERVMRETLEKSHLE